MHEWWLHHAASCWESWRWWKRGCHLARCDFSPHCLYHCCHSTQGGPLNKVIAWSPTDVSLQPPSIPLPVCHLIFSLVLNLSSFSFLNWCQINAVFLSMHWHSGLRQHIWMSSPFKRTTCPYLKLSFINWFYLFFPNLLSCNEKVRTQCLYSSSMDHRFLKNEFSRKISPQP